eukprot:275017-Prorocentrum_minimum.AAC.1
MGGVNLCTGGGVTFSRGRGGANGAAEVATGGGGGPEKTPPGVVTPPSVAVNPPSVAANPPLVPENSSPTRDYHNGPIQSDKGRPRVTRLCVTGAGIAAA